MRDALRRFKFCRQPRQVLQARAHCATMADMWKRSLKYALARAGTGLGLWSLLQRRHRRAWTIVCYHRILPAAQRAQYFCPDLVVTPESLAVHCGVYRDHFEVLPVREALTRFEHGDFSEKPLLSLSFDDGYRDNFHLAAPILATHGLCASFYVIAGLVDTNELPWYDRLARAASAFDAQGLVEQAKALPAAEREAFIQEQEARGNAISPAADLDHVMSSEQLGMLIARGHEIGAHSMTHPILPHCEPGALVEEIAGARGRLQQLTGAPVDTFCFPNGDYTPAVLEATRRAGYRAALSTAQGLNHRGGAPFTLRRVFIHEERLASSRGEASADLLRAELAITHRFRGR